MPARTSFRPVEGTNMAAEGSYQWKTTCPSGLTEREIDNFGCCESEFGENPGGSGPTTQEEAEPKICAAHPVGPIWNYPVDTWVA